MNNGTGWLRDYPDIRDYKPGDVNLLPMLGKANVINENQKFPDKTDLRQWCSPIDNQGSIGSCTAQAGTGIFEYYQKKAFGKYVNLSRLFLYKVTRNFLCMKGDTGAWLRSTMGAMTLFGCPPEKYWPYNPAKFEDEPTAFCYSFAKEFQALKYMRLDNHGTQPAEVLKRIKTYLAANIPSMFGFTCFQSLDTVGRDGIIPFPKANEKQVGGHAIVAVGYDDNRLSKGNGAFLIRNSWGTGWGESGYGWLPYQYVLRGLAVDWWVLLSSEFIDTGEFKI